MVRKACLTVPWDSPLALGCWSGERSRRNANAVTTRNSVLAGLAALLGLVAGAVALAPNPNNGSHSKVDALVG